MILSCRCIGIPTVKYEVLHTEIKPPKPLIVNSELTLRCWQDVKIQELTCDACEKQTLFNEAVLK